MNRDTLRLIASFLRGDDLVAFTEVSMGCYQAVGRPAPVLKWDVYQAARELNTLALRRHKVPLHKHAREMHFSVLFHMHKEYSAFAIGDAYGKVIARFRMTKDEEYFDGQKNKLCQSVYHLELILAGFDVAAPKRFNSCSLWYYWQEIVYRDDPEIIQKIVEYAGSYHLSCCVHAYGSLHVIRKLNLPDSFTADDLRKNPHEDAVDYMIRATGPFACLDECTSLPLAKKIVEIHGCDVRLANHGLMLAIENASKNPLELMQFWIDQGADNAVAAAVAATGQCAQFLMQRPEVQACADIICAMRIQDSKWDCDALVPYLRHPKVLSNIACTFGHQQALRAIPCGCCTHR